MPGMLGLVLTHLGVSLLPAIYVYVYMYGRNMNDQFSCFGIA